MKIDTTFKDVQMTLKHFFDISTGFRYKKMEKSSPSIYRDVHGLAEQRQDATKKMSQMGQIGGPVSLIAPKQT